MIQIWVILKWRLLVFCPLLLYFYLTATYEGDGYCMRLFIDLKDWRAVCFKFFRIAENASSEPVARPLFRPCTIVFIVLIWITWPWIYWVSRDRGLTIPTYSYMYTTIDIFQLTFYFHWLLLQYIVQWRLTSILLETCIHFAHKISSFKL